MSIDAEIKICYIMFIPWEILDGRFKKRRNKHRFRNDRRQ